MVASQYFESIRMTECCWRPASGLCFQVENSRCTSAAETAHGGYSGNRNESKRIVLGDSSRNTARSWSPTCSSYFRRVLFFQCGLFSEVGVTPVVWWGEFRGQKESREEAEEGLRNKYDQIVTAHKWGVLGTGCSDRFSRHTLVRGIWEREESSKRSVRC